MSDHVLLIQEIETSGDERLARLEDGRYSAIAPVPSKHRLLGHHEGRIYFSREVETGGVLYKYEIVRTRAEGAHLDVVGDRPIADITDLFEEGGKLYDVCVMRSNSAMVCETQESRIRRKIVPYDGDPDPVALLKGGDVFSLGTQTIYLNGQPYYIPARPCEFTYMAHSDTSIVASARDRRIFDVVYKRCILTLPIRARSKDDFICKFVMAGQLMYFVRNDDHGTIQWCDFSSRVLRVKSFRLPDQTVVRNFIVVPRKTVDSVHLDKGIS